MGRPFAIVVLTAVMLALSALAWAAPAGESRYPPIPLQPLSATETTVVQPGDHLWKISASHLSDSLDRAAEDSEIAPYWRLIIAENRDDLRSGNPDLIFPGEIVALPVASDSP